MLAIAVWLGLRPRSPQSAGSGGSPASNAAPDFTLTDLQGRPVRLADYRGKVVLVDFWATWCTPCRAEIPRFVAWQKQYGPEGLQVIGISMDDTEAPAKQYAKEMQISYPVAMGDAGLADRYGGVLGLPVNVLVARDGTIAHKYVGATDLASIERDITEQLAK